VCYGRIGVSTQEFGTLACWLINVLNILTGRLDEEGGAMFTLPAVDLVAGGGGMGRGHLGRWSSRVRGLPEFGGELPVAALAEEIDTPGPGQVRALVTAAGNPVLSAPNGARLERALGGLEYMVAIDFYLNETTRHAQLILPPTFALEREHYDLVFHVFGVRNTAKYSAPLFAPDPDARHDWQIYDALARRLEAARRPRLGAWLAGRLRGALGPRLLLDLALRTGPYGCGFRPWRAGLNLARLERAVHGIDLGALGRCLPERLATKNRRIDLAPAPLLADLGRLAGRLEALSSSSGDSLALIGRRDVRSNNSWMHNSRRLVKGPRRCTLLMHPADAAARGLADGMLVSVRSRVGSVQLPLEVSDQMMAGVVSLPHGWGHGRPGTRLEVAALHPGVSINDLTDELRLDSLSGNAAFNGTEVTVVPAA
jgi:anaerobic selenocysteine-containing dehydrogenase